MVIAVCFIAGLLAYLPLSATPLRGPAPERAEIERDLAALRERLKSQLANPRWADAAVFEKGVTWALRFEEKPAAADYALMRRAIEAGNTRCVALASRPDERPPGRHVCGFRSAVDGSVQPYGLVIPASYDSSRPIRLDVVLHGSSRPTGMSELRFMAGFMNAGPPPLPGAGGPYIELHPLGRVENCYRWAGETDVYEAIEDVCRRFKVDRNRIVLRGMSMGASGTWHLGLKRPDFFAALGPYCGYVDTHRFSETPGMNFVRVGPLPQIQEDGLHMLDSVDYAANAGIVPCVAAIGEKDPFFQAHVIMGEAFRREGLEMVNLISPGTAHVQDPAAWDEQMRRIAQAVDSRPAVPLRLRFVTWTLKYPRAHWLEALGLERHYRRAEIDAALVHGRPRVSLLANITRFAILPPASRAESAEIEGARIPIPAAARDAGAVFARRDGKWRCEGAWGSVRLTGKRPGLQGPIDDAFTRPFLCVFGTGTAWNPEADRWANRLLAQFADEWARYFRGDLPIKRDSDVTADDARKNNLILFGDPGSNVWIRLALPRLPIRWSRDRFSLAGGGYDSAAYVPALIAPSPFAQRDQPRYVALNSGHTFHAAELGRLNYLLFPRHGDWAVFDAKSESHAGAGPEPVRAGWLNEAWR